MSRRRGGWGFGAAAQPRGGRGEEGEEEEEEGEEEKQEEAEEAGATCERMTSFRSTVAVPSKGLWASISIPKALFSS